LEQIKSTDTNHSLYSIILRKHNKLFLTFITLSGFSKTIQRSIDV